MDIEHTHQEIVFFLSLRETGGMLVLTLETRKSTTMQYALLLYHSTAIRKSTVLVTQYRIQRYSRALFRNN